MKTQAIIAAGGVGTRLKQSLPKPLVKINGKPILAYTLEAFERSSLIDSVVLVGHKKYLGEMKNIVEKFAIKKVKEIVAGGKTRCESVYQGLMVTLPTTKMVVIHDAARPLISPKIINQAIRLARKYLAVVVAVAVKSTVKEIDPQSLMVKRTLPRETIWEIQTPQVFNKDLLLKAYAKLDPMTLRSGSLTDDASLVEQLGVKVRILPGHYRNIKITTQEDLKVVAALMDT